MDYRNAAKKELEEYSKLMQTEYAWLQEQAKRKKGAASGNLQRVPLGEAAAEGKDEENDGKEAETLPDEWVETGLINTPQLRYRAYEQAVPVLSLETAKTALVSIEELGCIKDRIPDCIVVYLDDEGNRWIRSFASLQDARKVTEEYVQDYLDELNDEGRMQEVFIDEGDADGIYPATPMEFVNDDESHKCEAEAKGMLHVIRAADHYIVYNELAKKTARWDIFSQIRQTFLLENVQEENGQSEKTENIESEKSAEKLGFFQKMRRKKEQKKTWITREITIRKNRRLSLLIGMGRHMLWQVRVQARHLQ